MRSSYLYYLFAIRWPYLLLALAGIVFAIARWRRHAKVSLLTVIGLSLLIFQGLTFASVYYFLPRLHDSGWSYDAINNLYTVANLCQDFLQAGVIILLVIAVFSQRERQIDYTKSTAPTEVQAS